jgi:hypothetical protein
MHALAILLLASLLCVRAAAAADAPIIYITRHGEKLWTLGCLNATGHARAQNFIAVFNSTFLSPKTIFANHYDDPIDCERCIQTAAPLAQHLELPVNATYGYPFWLGGNARAAAAIKEAAAAGQWPVLATWEHVNIQYLARDIGVLSSVIPVWGDDDYDTVYVIVLHPVSLLVSSFDVKRQNFRP